MLKQFRGRSPPTRQGALRPLAARSFCEKLQKCWQPFRAATGGGRAGLRGPRVPRLAPAAICGGRGWLGSVRERLQQKVASCPRGCPTGPCGPLPDAKLFARAVELEVGTLGLAAPPSAPRAICPRARASPLGFAGPSRRAKNVEGAPWGRPPSTRPRELYAARWRVRLRLLRERSSSARFAAPLMREGA